MYAIDFSYDGLFLSDFGMILCDFNGESGSNTISAGSKITFNKVVINKGKKYVLTGVQYDECITASFNIMKNPCLHNDIHITNDEYRDLMRWLNRSEFLKFQLFDEYENDRDVCYFNASFNIEKIIIGKELCGLNLTMETDKPYGYGEEHVVRLNITDVNKPYYLYDNSDEIGYIYPSVEITCNQSGNLTLKNITEDVSMTINNCSSGEVITVDGEAQIITSSLNSHALYDDFNFDFFRIGNTFEERRNVITSTLPCTVEITYYPIIKDIPM